MVVEVEDGVIESPLFAEEQTVSKEDFVVVSSEEEAATKILSTMPTGEDPIGYLTVRVGEGGTVEGIKWGTTACKGAPGRRYRWTVKARKFFAKAPSRAHVRWEGTLEEFRFMDGEFVSKWASFQAINGCFSRSFETTMTEEEVDKWGTFDFSIRIGWV